MNLHSHEFWQFSLEVYARSGVQSCCLTLQDDWLLNVNILLLCCYLEEKRLACSIKQFEQLTQSISETDQALKVHRKKRRAAKDQDKSLYQQLLKVELDLEKQQQTQLIEKVNGFELGEGSDNLKAYVNSQMNTGMEKTLENQLQQLRTLVSEAVTTRH